MPKRSSTRKWENTAHITKMSIEGLVATASLAAAITAILIATKVIAGPACLALVASPAGIAVLFIAAVYFAAAVYASYQQINAIGEKGAPGKEGPVGEKGDPGKDADFSALLGDAIKKGEIVEEEVNGNKQLSLKLSATDYGALTQGKNVDDEITLNVLLANKAAEVKFNHVAAANDNGNYKIQLTSVGGKDDLTNMKTELDMDTDSKSLKVAVSNKALKALKGKVATNLADVALENAISNAKKV